MAHGHLQPLLAQVPADAATAVLPEEDRCCSSPLLLLPCSCRPAPSYCAATPGVEGPLLLQSPCQTEQRPVSRVSLRVALRATSLVQWAIPSQALVPERGALETLGVSCTHAGEHLPLPRALLSSTRTGEIPAWLRWQKNAYCPPTPPCIAVCDQLLPTPAPRIRLPQTSVLHSLCGSVR